MAVQDQAIARALPSARPKQLLIRRRLGRGGVGPDLRDDRSRHRGCAGPGGPRRPEDVERAVRAARRAFAPDSEWRRMSPSDRGRLIHRIGDLILAHADELATLESMDNGKPRAVALAADVALSADLFHYMAGWATKLEGSTIPISAVTAPGARFHAYTSREPVGVVGQIIPWNFPLLMAAWKLGPVLACGCTVVLKPAERRR